VLKKPSRKNAVVDVPADDPALTTVRFTDGLRKVSSTRKAIGLRALSQGNRTVIDDKASSNAFGRKSHGPKQHIEDFQLACSAFFATNPYMIGIKENTKTEKRVYYPTRAEPVPDSVTAVASDVIQNLRSPLDQLAFQLVVAANPAAKSEKIYYPIRDTSALPIRYWTHKKVREARGCRCD
jgi:hypothetical protein